MCPFFQHRRLPPMSDRNSAKKGRQSRERTESGNSNEGSQTCGEHNPLQRLKRVLSDGASSGTNSKPISVHMLYSAVSSIKNIFFFGSCS